MSVNRNDDDSSQEVQNENKYASIINNKLILTFDSESSSKDENIFKPNDSINSKTNNNDDISINSMNEKNEKNDITTNINNVNNFQEIPNELQTNQTNQNNTLNNNNNYTFSSNININVSGDINSK